MIVDFENQLQVARQDAAHHVQRPGFQRLAHQRVVGVREHLLHHFPGVEPLEFVLVDQPVHQLGNRQYRVGVVEVNGDFVRQVVEGFVHQPMAIEDILYRGDTRKYSCRSRSSRRRRSNRPDTARATRSPNGFIFHRREVIALVELAEVDLVTGLRAHNRSVLVASVSKPGIT